MKETFSNRYKGSKSEIRSCVQNFESSGKKFDERNRNSLKIFEIDGTQINIKSFKKPHLINQVIYRFFRPSKSQRSFEYAHRLIENNILTPDPIGYFEEKSLFKFKRSYYASLHLNYDLTYRELVNESQFTGNKEILEAFGKFTYALHKKGVHFLDHSMGNTLIKIQGNGQYDFYLVDLNRMRFGPMSFKKRMANFERLSSDALHIRHMAAGYAQASGENEDLIYNAIKKAITTYQIKRFRKKRWKKRLFHTS